MAERRRAQEGAAAAVLAAALACLRGPGTAKEPKEALTAAVLARPTLKTMQAALHLLHLRIRGAARTKKVRRAAAAAGCPQLPLSQFCGGGCRSAPCAQPTSWHACIADAPDASTITLPPSAPKQELQHIYPVLEPGQAKEFKAAMQEWVRELGELEVQAHGNGCGRLDPFVGSDRPLRVKPSLGPSLPPPLHPPPCPSARSGAAGQLQPDSVKYFVSAYQGSAAHRAVLLLLDLRWAGARWCSAGRVLQLTASAKRNNTAHARHIHPHWAQGMNTERNLCSNLCPTAAARLRWQRSWGRGRTRRCPMPTCCGPAALRAPARRLSMRTERRLTRNASCRLTWTQWWQPCSA